MPIPCLTWCIDPGSSRSTCPGANPFDDQLAAKNVSKLTNLTPPTGCTPTPTLAHGVR
ncbi:MAG: hypothetical protein V9G08_07300 [Dermatophilaceae bacterium]